MGSTGDNLSRATGTQPSRAKFVQHRCKISSFAALLRESTESVARLIEIQKSVCVQQYLADLTPILSLGQAPGANIIHIQLYLSA